MSSCVIKVSIFLRVRNTEPKPTLVSGARPPAMKCTRRGLTIISGSDPVFMLCLNSTPYLTSRYVETAGYINTLGLQRVAENQAGYHADRFQWNQKYLFLRLFVLLFVCFRHSRHSPANRPKVTFPGSLELSTFFAFVSILTFSSAAASLSNANDTRW